MQFKIKEVVLVNSDKEVNYYLSKNWVIYRIFDYDKYLMAKIED